MKLIHTSDGEYYRRWVNAIPNILLPGSAQFLAGRRIAGLVWFFGYLAVGVMLISFLIYPTSRFAVTSPGLFQWATLPLMILIVVDGCRRPIRRLHFKGWAMFCCVWICLLGLPFIGIRTYFVQAFKVPTGAMSPTIIGDHKGADGNQISGDHIFVNKLIYRYSTPQRGDVVVFSTKEIKAIKKDASYIKRVVGLPGETIRIDPPYILINDRRLTEPTIFQKITEGRDGYEGYFLASATTGTATYLASPSDKIILGPDEYFVMGDKSKSSLDGRYFGPIKRSAIVGKAFYIYAPADRKGRIE